MRFKVVAFDVDGTLYSNPIMYLRSIPFALRRPFLLRAFGRVRRELRKIRPIENFHRTQAELLARERGICSEEAERLIQDVFYNRWERVVQQVRPLPHVAETLAALKEGGYRIAALSDFPLGTKLEAFGLGGIWDYARSSEDIGYLKPAPEPFLDLVETFGVPPAQILYVGNNYAYDIQGARNQGLATAHLTGRPRADSVADFSFRHYRALRDWIFSSR